MTTKIEQYNVAKREQNACIEWAGLICNPYRGGGGGVGELRKLSLGSVTVYHQYSDGATNYHDMPASLAPHLCAAIKANFGKLLADALALQDAALKAAAAEAVKEHGKLLHAAGLAARNQGEQ